ncbi:Spo0E family sporulation regulatory protein-aspartic acid phosphatase [Paenibacillus sp. PK3_47]|uniref:aspartyl-phosphate phosphatase Spo0E family protein n=1 Tax=Paenibacillus sp. PK3_47 TaxID=2072642 RepID=UPI00201D5D54|nr:aspartyl-phosphate phosphatase Spo0E family protein [Paenibacillus sp. PK3_47]UQZ35164.1 Spo0E family sporulation regulatory protein-aspartic acid phosphatase [Paenibacillus sp. PK3_47]
MKELTAIHRQIERERAKLNQMEQQYGLNHASVIRQSVKLDELINTYNRLDMSTKDRQ